MLEGTNGVAELPEIDIRVFQQFLVSLYSSIPRGCDVDKTPNGYRHKYISRSKIIELLLAKDKKEFRCKTCSHTSWLKFSTTFPYCTSCTEQREMTTYWRKGCMVASCYDAGDQINGWFCNSCWNDLRENIYVSSEEDGPKLRVHIESSLSELASFRFDIPLRAVDIAEAMADEIGSIQISTSNILENGRLALFADVYQVQPLLEKALVALYRNLATMSFDDDNLTTLIDLASIVYDGTTPTSADAPYEEKHVLRRMISEYIAAHLQKFVTPSSLAQIAGLERDLTSDTLVAIARQRSDQNL